MVAGEQETPAYETTDGTRPARGDGPTETRPPDRQTAHPGPPAPTPLDAAETADPRPARVRLPAVAAHLAETRAGTAPSRHVYGVGAVPTVVALRPTGDAEKVTRRRAVPVVRPGLPETETAKVDLPRRPVHGVGRGLVDARGTSVDLRVRVAVGAPAEPADHVNGPRPGPRLGDRRPSGEVGTPRRRRPSRRETAVDPDGLVANEETVVGDAAGAAETPETVADGGLPVTTVVPETRAGETAVAAARAVETAVGGDAHAVATPGVAHPVDVEVDNGGPPHVEGLVAATGDLPTDGDAAVGLPTVEGTGNNRPAGVGAALAPATMEGRLGLGAGLARDRVAVDVAAPEVVEGVPVAGVGDAAVAKANIHPVPDLRAVRPNKTVRETTRRATDGV